jgi:hypothetical protein
MLTADREQVLAFRLAGHHLHRRTDPLTAIGACGTQESPPGWWGVALHARSKGEPEPADLVLVNAMRGAPHFVPRADAAVFTVALVPPDDEVRAMVGSRAAKEAEAGGLSPRAALDAVADAARDGLADGPLGRDEFHQAMRERLPEALLPWCRGCESNHVRPGFWRSLGPIGVTQMPEKATYASADWPEMPIETARAELARRFLRCFGPAKPAELARWAQTSGGHAKTLFALIDDELEEVRYGGGKRWVLASDTARLESPPAATGVRLLGGFDAFVSQPDREALAPAPALRKRMFPSIGRPGIVLEDGVMTGLWKGLKKGAELEVSVHRLGSETDIAAEAKVIAPLRGCETARVVA